MKEIEQIACPDSAVSPRAERLEQKWAQALEGARAVFMTEGFEGASIDDIARKAGISKATLYRHFPDKTALFREVVRQELGKKNAEFPPFAAEACGLDIVLFEFARASIQFVFSPCGLGIYRTAVAESERFPEIAESFYACGPYRGRTTLAPVLKAAAERGELMLDDPEHAADVFYAICKAGKFNELLFMGARQPTEEEVEALATRAVETFLRAFRYKPAESAQAGPSAA